MDMRQNRSITTLASNRHIVHTTQYFLEFIDPGNAENHRVYLFGSKNPFDKKDERYGGTPDQVAQRIRKDPVDETPALCQRHSFEDMLNEARSNLPEISLNEFRRIVLNGSTIRRTYMWPNAQRSCLLVYTVLGR